MAGAAASYPFEGDPLPVAVRMTSSGSAAEPSLDASTCRTALTFPVHCGVRFPW
jgi:hypothetical protein